MNGYDFILDDLNWSFSNLKTFTQCPFEWRLKYLDAEEGIENIYGQFGTVCHKVLENFFTGKCSVENMKNQFEVLFRKSVILNGSRDEERSEKLHQIGILYFSNFSKQMFPIKRVVGVEKKIDCDFYGKKFIGFIDLVYIDNDDRLVVLDHKTAESPLNKNGSIKKAKIKDYDFYKKQLYIYCMGIKKLYNRYPDKIGWNFIRSGDLHIIDFNKEDYEESCEWAMNVIDNIYDTDKFQKNEQYFYCNNLCRFRNICYTIDEEELF